MNNYYEENHQQYFDSTVSIDPSAFLEPLAKWLEPSSTVLDIGCGSGRDLRWFANRGFQPTGFEYAPGLADLARQHAGCSVIEGDFRSYDFSSLQFSALVFVGSLVHIPRESFSDILKSICKALVARGLILITMKEGRGTSFAPDGRIFTLWSQKDIEKVFSANNLHILEFSKTISTLRHDDIWLGYVLRQRNGA